MNSLVEQLEGDQRTGVEILQRALVAPVHHIATNAGHNGDVVIEAMRNSGQGFNALTGTYEDLMAAGIVDAAKVVRLAVQDAVSIASLLITTEVVIADKPEPEALLPMAVVIPWEAWVEWAAWACPEWAVWVEWAAWACPG